MTAARRAALRLSWALLAGAIAASLGGLLLRAPYRDNAFVTAAWFGNDLVTLLVAAPLMACACVGAARASARWTLVWLGMLDYVLYNFAFYLFGASLNAMFLLYEGLVVGAIAALILGLTSLDARPYEGLSVPRGRAVAVASGVLAFGLGALWAGQSVAFALGGAVPAVVTATGGRTNVVAALDLMLVVPVMALTAALLWRGHRWGLALGVVAHTKGAVYMLALATSSAIASSRGIADVGAQVPIWAALGAVDAGALWLLLGATTTVVVPSAEGPFTRPAPRAA